MARYNIRFEISLIIALFCMAFSLGNRPAAADEPLKKGERVVFLGDSITQAGAGAGGYVTLAKEALAKKYPNLGIEVIGAGISGNRVPDLEARLDRDGHTSPMA